MQQILTPSALQFLGNRLSGSAFEVEPAPAVRPEAKTGSDPLFLDTLRANLHAAAQHAALGHKGSSFRDCCGASCIEAANLIPELEPKQSATDAELDSVLDQVLLSLEREGTSFLAPKPS